MATATTNPKTGNDIVTVSSDDWNSHLDAYVEEASTLGFSPNYWPPELELESMSGGAPVTMFRGKTIFENDQFVGVVYENPNCKTSFRIVVLND